MADLPNWTSFDASVAPPLPDHSERPGRLVTVLSTSSARANGWAASATAALAAGWASEGRRVVVADVGLERPSFHEISGEANAEGVVDVVQFGCSVRRVARQAPEGGYFYISAGTPVADAAAVLGSPRWKRLCEGFLDAGVTLVALADADCRGCSEVLAVSTDLVLLAAENEDVDGLVSGVDAHVCLFSGPPEPTDAGPFGRESVVSRDREGDSGAHMFSAVLGDSGAATSDPLTADESTLPVDPDTAGDSDSRRPSEENSGDVSDEAALALMEGGLAATYVEDVASGGPVLAHDLPDPEAAILDEVALGPPVAKAGVRHRVLLGLVLVLLLIVASAAMGWVQIPGISPEGSKPVIEKELAPAALSVPVSPTAPDLAYSVAVGAFPDEQVAISSTAALTVVEGLLVLIAPVSVNGRVFHRVLLGPATDSASAEALATRVAQEVGISRSEWIVRATPVAFLLGEIPNQDAATRRVAVLRGLNVQAYMLAVDFADGSVRYRVYAGAYADSEEASYLQSHLINQGLDNATVAPRVGRVL